MKAQSSVYIKLQNLYKDKARADAAEVLSSARGMAGGENIDAETVEQFCKNARFIALINDAGSSVPTLTEITGKNSFVSPWRESSRLRNLTLLTITPLPAEQELGNDEMAAIAGPIVPYSLLPIYLALTATSHVETASSDNIMASVSERAPAAAGNERFVKVAEEVARVGGGELHNISAVIGGMVAQEMIKIITKQYIPIDNTCIFDGIDSRCQVLRL